MNDAFPEVSGLWACRVIFLPEYIFDHYIIKKIAPSHKMTYNWINLNN